MAKGNTAGRKGGGRKPVGGKHVASRVRAAAVSDASDAVGKHFAASQAAMPAPGNPAATMKGFTAAMIRPGGGVTP